MMYIKPKKTVNKIKDVKSYMTMCEIERLVRGFIWSSNLAEVRSDMLAERRFR